MPEHRRAPLSLHTRDLGAKPRGRELQLQSTSHGAGAPEGIAVNADDQVAVPLPIEAAGGGGAIVASCVAGPGHYAAVAFFGVVLHQYVNRGDLVIGVDGRSGCKKGEGRGTTDVAKLPSPWKLALIP